MKPLAVGSKLYAVIDNSLRPGKYDLKELTVVSSSRIAARLEGPSTGTWTVRHKDVQSSLLCVEMSKPATRYESRLTCLAWEAREAAEVTLRNRKWVDKHRHEIRDVVGRLHDAERLQQIAAICGYNPPSDD